MYGQNRQHDYTRFLLKSINADVTKVDLCLISKHIWWSSFHAYSLQLSQDGYNFVKKIIPIRHTCRTFQCPHISFNEMQLMQKFLDGPFFVTNQVYLFSEKDTMQLLFSGGKYEDLIANLKTIQEYDI